MTVCWNEDEATALKTAHEIWPNAGLGRAGSGATHPGPLPAGGPLVTEKIAESVVVGPDASKYLAKIDEYVQAGFDHIYIHQVGPDQEGFIFAEREILPQYAAARSRAA